MAIYITTINICYAQNWIVAHDITSESVWKEIIRLKLNVCHLSHKYIYSSLDTELESSLESWQYFDLRSSPPFLFLLLKAAAKSEWRLPLDRMYFLFFASCVLFWVFFASFSAFNYTVAEDHCLTGTQWYTWYTWIIQRQISICYSTCILKHPNNKRAGFLRLIWAVGSKTNPNINRINLTHYLYIQTHFFFAQDPTNVVINHVWKLCDHGRMFYI